MAPTPAETLELGVFGRPHGVRGGVLFWPHNPASDALRVVRRGVRVASDGSAVAVRIIRAAPAGKGWALTLEGCTRREDAEALVGQSLRIDPALLPALDDDDAFYYHEVMGAEVVSASGARLGVVTDVFETSTDVLTVALADGVAPGGTLDVPVVGAYVVRIDRAARRVVLVDDAVALLALPGDDGEGRGA